MSDVYLIEVNDEAVGLVARDPEAKAYRFHAALKSVFTLDGQLFPTPSDAQRAARHVLESRGRGAAALPASQAA